MDKTTNAVIFPNTMFITLIEYIDVKKFIKSENMPVLIKLGKINDRQTMYIHVKEYGYA